MRGLGPRASLLLGAVSTVAFLGVGASVYVGGSPVGGFVLVALGVYRGVMWVREARGAFEPDEP
ncbi:MAG: hypothetical protein H6737_20445 [Alphaproteobacteria bacterium]|nr:hypothetical protein [Alphaproteobacteria bacterium]